MTKTDAAARLSIGALSQLVGVPVETLRTWERRYGAPAAERLPSGHRRYRADQVPLLCAWRDALRAGHHASDVLGLDLPAVLALLAIGGAGQAAATSAAAAGDAAARLTAAEAAALVAEWIAAAQALDGDRLARSMLAAWSRHGVLAFADRLAGPFLDALGQAWAEGRLSVGQEHAASERMRDLCTSQWRGHAPTRPQQRAVLACLPGERHGLGLELAAAALTAGGIGVVFAGTDTPLAEIAALVDATAADVVAVSVSRYADAAETAAALAALRAWLPEGVRLCAGGAGVPPACVGVEVLDSFAALVAWAAPGARAASATA